MYTSRSPKPPLLAASQLLSAGTSPRAITSEAWMPTEARRIMSEVSYSRAAITKVVAMLATTMSAIAIQKSRKMRTNRLGIGHEGQGVAGAAHVFDLGVAARLQFELAAQVADVRVDAAIVGHEFA